MTIDKETKQEIVERFGDDEQDTGSTTVQIALLTERINDLTVHLNEHKKDFSSQRGLRKLVGQRRRLLKYLRQEDLDAYKELIQQLGIRGV